MPPTTSPTSSNNHCQRRLFVYTFLYLLISSHSSLFQVNSFATLPKPLSISSSSSSLVYLSCPLTSLDATPKSSPPNSQNRPGITTTTTKTTTSRRRNNSSKNTTGSRNKAWHARRAAGIKVKNTTNKKKTPRWEKEGDSLYHAVGSGTSNNNMDALEKKKVKSLKEARELLSNVVDNMKKETAPKKDQVKKSTSNTQKDKAAAAVPSPPLTTTTATPSAPPHTLWGSLPVGPILRQSLQSSSFPSPTSIQSAAFGPITSNKNNNVVIASPTGTGKSLAFLVPLLTKTNRVGGGTKNGKKKKKKKKDNNKKIVLLITPTTELAKQLQRNVDLLWPPIQIEEEEEEGMMQSSVHVVINNDKKDNDEEGEEDTITSLLSKNVIEVPIVAGTPRSIRSLLAEARAALKNKNDDNDDNNNEEEERREIAKELIDSLENNLQTIVLDEADRLLRTENVARNAWERQQLKLQQQQQQQLEEAAEENENNASIKKKKTTKKKKPSSASGATPRSKTQTELLFQDLSIPPPPYLKHKHTPQIICASATVGRTLRRQLMNLLQMPSMDKTATLITSEEDARAKGKDASRRRGSLIPDTLSHCYSFVSSSSSSSSSSSLGGDDSTESALEKNTGNKADTTRTTSTILKKNKKQRKEQEAKLLLQDTIQTVKYILKHHFGDDPAPTLIFPGRFGVEQVQKELLECNEEDLRLRILSLKDISSTSSSSSAAAAPVALTTSFSSSSPKEEKEKQQEEKIQHNIKTKTSWDNEKVYIIGDKFARGLDIPNIRYVFILSPPSSAAGYAHLAGRTGRNGMDGTAITVLNPKEVYKYVGIVEGLGLNGVKELVVAPDEDEVRIDGLTVNDKFSGDDDGGGDDDDKNATAITNTATMSTKKEEDDKEESSSAASHPWKLLSEATLKRKTIAELTKYLDGQGVTLPRSQPGKRILKQDLISTIQKLN